MKITQWINIFGFIASKFVDTREIYNNLKNDPEERKVTTYMGKHALINLAIFALLFIGGPTLTIWCINSFLTEHIFLGIIILMAGVIIGLYGVVLIPIILNYTIKQLKLNKRFIGWLALVLFIIIVAVGTLAFLIIANM